ncbi:NAD(P)/FAD-dependent oxidoreductase [Streptomyces sp. ISL-86]|uniref:FAD-dependent oxidoreductase n=1 Tax=Streptomyces sp. ISL-86 TaxID=2819187 RepID=UPI001BE4E871|nr:FAD-dependent monooxygenase [Streptomyces sp. ISL-86]MBT2458320.1 FAD-dependent monooxygenase [Streptomyces sp. ISL-86]
MQQRPHSYEQQAAPSAADSPGTASRAVVIGAGVAGLLAAVALAPSFDEVVILERDRLTPEQTGRPGVPQASHPHGLLVQGLKSMERLLPGIQEEMRAAGAPVVDLGEKLALSARGHSTPPRTTGLRAQFFSRPFLESHVRARTLSLPRIRLQDGTTVTGLSTTDGSQITGVHTQKAHGEKEETVRADLVIDASGRSSRTPRWLTGLGYRVPPNHVIDSKIGYATASLDGSTTLQRDRCQSIYEVGQMGTLGRGAVWAVQENGRSVITVFGRDSDRPGSDLAGFKADIRRLGNPLLIGAADSLAPDTPIHRYAQLFNRCHRYHTMSPWPQRFLVVGDATYALNPLYGQGMTVAALQAETIRTAAPRLNEHPARTRAVQRSLARRARLSWVIATAQDSRWTEQPPAYGRVLGWLLDRMLDRVMHSSHLHVAFLKTMNLIAPLSLLSPRALAALLAPANTRHGAGS